VQVNRTQAELALAINAVKQACSETSLDVQVAAALMRLDDIEAGYRAFLSQKTAVVRAHPLTVTIANDK
jgi:hypothetical protein